MSLTKEDRRREPRQEPKRSHRKKKNALVISNDGKEFWTTQNQFWQWVREKVIIKAGDNPLRGNFVVPNGDKTLIAKNAVLNLSNQNGRQETLAKKE